MNANKRTTSVQPNSLLPTKSKLGADDLSSAEMPELTVVTDTNDESLVNVPAPLTVADVEGSELKPIRNQLSTKSRLESVPPDPEILQVRFRTLDSKLNLLFPTEKKLTKSGDNDQSQLLSPERNQLDDSATSLLNMSWEEILFQMEQRMAASGNEWKPRSQVYLQAGERLLDTRQLQQV